MSIPFHEARTTASLTQVQISEATGVPQRTVSDFDRGYVPRSIRAAARLAALVGLTLEEMFPDAATMPLSSDESAEVTP